jgi:4-carboxymuconolactone decarboxylase
MLQERLSAGSDIAERVDSVSDIAPNLARYLLAYPFGDAPGDAGLDGRTRALAAVAGLTVLGNDRQLRVQIGRARDLGCSAEEIVATITQMVDYAGITTALNALSVAKAVLRQGDEGDEQD